jgi:hypothetical protein
VSGGYLHLPEPISTCCRVGRDHIESSGEKLSRPTRTYNASTNYRDAPYWFVKSHVIVSSNVVSASYTWEESVPPCVCFADWKDSSEIGQLLGGNRH